MSKPGHLTPQHWIDAGFQALRTHGATALRAEVLARDLKTTKGSFYWHFADVPAFHVAMIAQWEASGLAAPDQPTNISPATALREFAQMLADSAHHPAPYANCEPAIRAWAQSDKGVALALARVDAARLNHLGGLLRALTITNPDFARIIYGACIGLSDQAQRGGAPGDQSIGTLVDLVLALR